jgi:hypothetical protein
MDESKALLVSTLQDKPSRKRGKHEHDLDTVRKGICKASEEDVEPLHLSLACGVKSLRRQSDPVELWVPLILLSEQTRLSVQRLVVKESLSGLQKAEV